MSRSARKIEADGFVDLRLHRAGNNLLDRVFNGDDVASAKFSKMAQTGVNRRGLAAARRAGEQEQDARLTKKCFQFRTGALREFNFVQGFDRSRIEQPEDNLFAGDGRVSGNADVVFTFQFVTRNTPILW